MWWKRGSSRANDRGTGPVISQVRPSDADVGTSRTQWDFAQVRTAASPGELVIVDTETTGLDRNARVIELAWIVTTPDLEIVTKGSSVIRGNGNGGNPQARAVHRIPDKEIRHAPDFQEVWTQLRGHVNGRLLVAHNSRFDRKMINYELARFGADPIENMACTMKLAQELNYADSGKPGPDFRPAKLEALARRLQLEVHPTHRALQDAETALALLRYLMHHHPAASRRYLSQFWS